MINYFYPGDVLLKPVVDPFADQHGEPGTHLKSEIVERLIELQYSADGFSLSGARPIYLQLQADGQARNWEAIARLDEIGFLLATDKFPETILGFVAYPK